MFSEYRASSLKSARPVLRPRGREAAAAAEKLTVTLSDFKCFNFLLIEK